MDIKEFDKNTIITKIDNFTGLSHIGNGKNEDIERYYHSFRTWLEWNNVLKVANNYANVHMDLRYVTSQDFLMWLLHHGDVYDNYLRYQLRLDPTLDYKKDAREFYYLRQLHPKFSFTVALASHMPANNFLSDNNLDEFIPLLAHIPNNEKQIKNNHVFSEFGSGLFEAIYSLSNFAVERVSKDCF